MMGRAGRACQLLLALVLSLLLESRERLVWGYFILNFLLSKRHSIFSLLVTSVAHRRCTGTLALGAGGDARLPQLTALRSSSPVSPEAFCLVNAPGCVSSLISPTSLRKIASTNGLSLFFSFSQGLKL